MDQMGEVREREVFCPLQAHFEDFGPKKSGRGGMKIGSWAIAAAQVENILRSEGAIEYST